MLEKTQNALRDGKILESTAENLTEWLRAGFLPDWALQSIAELFENEHFEELNDRFFQPLQFGTGGMRGRTIGHVTTSAETGPDNTPAHPAIGSNTLNDFNVIRATIGLYRYSEKFLAQERRLEQPLIVIAHDVRYFSRHFSKLAASVWSRLGGKAAIYPGARSTPQLSYTVRKFGATAGIVITASHNPPHDNGFKVYFEDGAQIIEPHASGIINEVNSVKLSELADFTDNQPAEITTLPDWADKAYLEQAAAAVLDPDVFTENPLKVVFSPIHGTAAVQCIPLMKRFNIQFDTVPEQMIEDPAFSTVKSPNPENAEALAMAIDLANKNGADIVIATDPDCDRMGVAARNRAGEMKLLSGNQIGALLTDYRIRTMKKLGWIPENGTQSAAIIKTFVTSELLGEIARSHGLKVIETLTGFKWITAKLREWEDKLVESWFSETGIAINYPATKPRTRAKLLQEKSTFYVFGGEESYGYLTDDSVRDKDGNTAVIAFCELAASIKRSGKTLHEALDDLYQTYGYFEEGPGELTYTGAAGAAKIKKILESYRENPPTEIGGVKVVKFTDFGRDEIRDADGSRIPPQNFYFLELATGYSCAVRGSGTEPKLKFYLFAREPVQNGDLETIKKQTKERIATLRSAMKTDASSRAEN